MAGGDVAGQWSGTTDATDGTRDAVALYDTYGDALFGFSVELVRDRELAERVLRDTLLMGARRLRVLRERSRTRALLYALARAECERAAPWRPGPGVVEQVLTAGAAVWIVPDRHRLAPLVPYALWAVDEVERIALDLSVRHGLGGAEIADVLAIPERHVGRTLARGRQQFEQAVAVYAVATHPRRDCPELALLLPDAGAAVDSALRRPLHLHVDSCPDCVVLGPDAVDAGALLGGGALPPAPYGIRIDLLAADLGGEAVDAGRNGFPKGLGRPRSRVPVAVGCLVATSLVLGLVAFARVGDDDRGSPVALSTAQEPDRPVFVHPSPSAEPSAVASTPPPPPTTAAAPGTRAATPKPTAKTTRGAKPTTGAPAPPGAGAQQMDPRSATTDANAAGTLTWSQRDAVDLGVGGAPRTVRLTATGGPVTWSLGVSENDWLTVSPRSGSLRAGQSVSITISANPDKAPAPTWTVTLSLRPNGDSLTVEGVGRRLVVR
ncbi:BACON domain-containing protein [Embleya sp. NBC_00896]|uniref:BACON domain-containing protein n=1 Tax=Embleya sp. NBC_00896 TaxID=2975961 RepID=UPI00386DDDC6|nr:hypothetical protein OG928_19095 [Embleya sp. NBC_00896]